jgi:hypothetical protein
VRPASLFNAILSVGADTFALNDSARAIGLHGHGDIAPVSSKPATTNPNPVEQPQTGDVAVPTNSETAKAYYEFLTEHYKFDVATYHHTEAVLLGSTHHNLGLNPPRLVGSCISCPAISSDWYTNF